MFEGISGVIAVCILIAIGVAGDRAAKKRKKAFWDRYGSFEGFRGQVDTERIEEVRRASGDVVAIKVLRKEYPNVSLVMAKRYVDELAAA